MKLTSLFTCLFILTASGPLWSSQIQDGKDCVMCEGKLPDISNEPLIITPEDMKHICAYYSASASLDQGHTFVMMKYGSMDRFYAAYDQIKCGQRGVLPLEVVIERGDYQTEGIIRDLEGLAALPEAQRLNTINRAYKFAGRNQTILDRINRLVRDLEEDNKLPDNLKRVKVYQEALVKMGAKAYRDL